MRRKITEAQRRQIRRMIKSEFENKIINESFNAIMTEGRNRELLLIRKGYSQRHINEGIMDWAKSIFNTDSIVDTVKKAISTKLLGMLGLNPDEDPIIFSMIQNILEAIDYTEISKYFGDESCDELIKLITEAITEVVTEEGGKGGRKLIAYLATKMFGKFSKDSGGVKASIEQTLSTISQEAINEVVVKMVQGILQEPMKEIICNSSLMDMLKGLKNTVSGSLLGKAGQFLGFGKGKDKPSMADMSGILGDAGGVAGMDLGALGSLASAFSGDDD